MSINLNTTQEFYELIKASDLAIVYFWAPWCNPCKKFAPYYEQCAQNISVPMKKIDIDNDNLSEIAINYGIQSIPTLIAFSKGVEIGREIGVPDDLEGFVNSFKK